MQGKPQEEESGDESHANINNYIHNLDVSNVLNVDLGSLDSHYIDPSLANEYRRAQQQQQQIQQPVPARNRSLSIEEQPADQQSQSQSQPPSRPHSQPNSQELSLNEIPEDYDYVADPMSLPGVPKLPEGVDPKRMCPFCQKTFSHPGSMGRHLDLKKGTRLHPADLIDKMRAGVKRRGDQEKVKARRRIRARKYNSRPDVREYTKVQRRVRDKLNRAKRSYIHQFYHKLSKPELDDYPTFPRIVVYFLSPCQWPHDPPTLETYKTVCGVLNDKFQPGDKLEERFYEDVMKKVRAASENWLTLTDTLKQEVWLKELRRAASEALTNTSLYDLANRDEWVLKEAKKKITRAEKNNGELSGGEEDEDEKSDKERDYYDQAELAAVAEAVVNNSSNNKQQQLGPELMN